MSKDPTVHDVVVACQNRLGWVSKLDDNMPVYKVRAIEATRLQKSLVKREKTYTPAQLLMAVELAAKRRTTVSPLGLLTYVDEALESAAIPDDLTDLGAAIQDAINHEYEMDRPDLADWVRRLNRATGPWRADVLDDWRAAGRHQKQE